MTERCRLCDEPAELGDLCVQCEDRAITDSTASPCPLFFDYQTRVLIGWIALWDLRRELRP